MIEPRYQPETGCAATAQRRGDLLFASAPPAERWLLIESRAPWPRDALASLRWSSDWAAESGSLGEEVAERCAELRCRPALIRRYGRLDRTAARRWALVDSRPGRESVRWGELPTDEHALEVLDGQDRGRLSDEPVYLVCTHGRHDACCAVWGRPVAASLAAAYPERTWECSHVGGDRFAANVVLLPHGIFYGHVPPERVVELVEQYDEVLVVPDLMRGLGGATAPVQAAQHFARAAGSTLSVDSLHPVSVHQLAHNEWKVVLYDRGEEVAVVVASDMVTVDGSMTCSTPPPGRVRVFRLVGEVGQPPTGT